MTTRRKKYCSFCYSESRLISGPGVYICYKCIDFCTEIVATGRNGDHLLPRTREALDFEKFSLMFKELGLRPAPTPLKFRRRDKHAFLLCPFAEPFNTIYADHIRPAVQEVGFSIDRADEIFGTQPIIEDIWTSINTAHVVIADVTGRNPNVMYEIGMAHTVGRPTLIITQDINDVPFDVKHHRCVVYSYTPRGCEQLRKRIARTLRFLQ
jgi:hypothetical protein